MSIDIGSAAFSGFGLVARRPLSVLIWGLLYLILLGVPALYFLSKIGPEILEMIRAAGTSGQPGSSAAVTAMLSLFQHALGLGLLLLLLNYIVKGVIISAIMRAVFEPQNIGVAYLRLGGQELWQILLAIATGLLLFILSFALSLVGSILTAAMGGMGHGGAGLGGLLVRLVILFIQIYIGLRLALAPAMTFNAKSFRLFESWGMTQGRFLPLFLIALILFVILLIFEFVVGGGLVAYVISNKDVIRSQIQANADPTTLIKSMGPLVAIGVAVGSLFGGALTAIWLVPFATVYKQLTPAAAASEVF